MRRKPGNFYSGMSFTHMIPQRETSSHISTEGLLGMNSPVYLPTKEKLFK